MAKLIYRVVSVCGALGYGYPKSSLDEALKGRIDAVISDAGSMDAGPYFLGTGTEYFEREAVKRDFTLMVRAVKEKNCPLILGSCGMAGGNKNLEWMLDVAKEVFAEQNFGPVKVAVVNAEINPDVIIREFRNGTIIPLGAMDAPSEEALRESIIVGQMGIHPILTAFEAGAQIILLGRSCDIALFASDMIRHHIDPGIAFHVGHVLECGALACTPGSPSDCLVAEVYDDGSALFIAPNPERKCTPASIAAHSLYEEAHPELQYYPEGILCMTNTEFFAHNERVAGIRNSIFVHSEKPWPFSIKLEGSRKLGNRFLSLVYIDAKDLEKIPMDYPVYGRNAVEKHAVKMQGENEIGIIVETSSDNAESALFLASLITHYMVHYGYPERKSTAGNLAYPLSPNTVPFRRKDGSYGALVVSGTRDPIFQKDYELIKKAVLDEIKQQFPDALQKASYTIKIADKNNPVIMLRTIDKDENNALEKHKAEISAIQKLVKIKPESFLELKTHDCYVWSLYHLITNEDLIKKEFFPITLYEAKGNDWKKIKSLMPVYTDIGVKNYHGEVDARKLSLIKHESISVKPVAQKPLSSMASVIRSKDAGVDCITYDIIFNSEKDFQLALKSNTFTKENIAKFLQVPLEKVIGAYHVDTCNAIKISIDRPIVSASPTELDVFGCQQAAELILMQIPIYDR